MKHDKKPYLKNWYFLFAGKKDANSPLENQIRKFIDGPETKLDVNGLFCLVGAVYGRDGFEDGTVVKTSSINSLEKLDSKVYCATNYKGGKYYLYLSEAEFDFILRFGLFEDEIL